MKEYFGWTQASDTAAVYVHLSGRDVDSALLKLAGKASHRNGEEIGGRQTNGNMSTLET